MPSWWLCSTHERASIFDRLGGRMLLCGCRAVELCRSWQSRHCPEVVSLGRRSLLERALRRLTLPLIPHHTSTPDTSPFISHFYFLRWTTTTFRHYFNPSVPTTATTEWSKTLRVVLLWLVAHTDIPVNNQRVLPSKCHTESHTVLDVDTV